MATELDRVLANALRDVKQILTIPAAEYVPAIPDAWEAIDAALAAYDTAQSQPGDMGEARSGESGAVVIARELYERLDEWLEDFGPSLEGGDCSELVEATRASMAKYERMSARELDAARDRGKARTAEGVGGGAEDWDNGTLGKDARYVRRSSQESDNAVQDALGLPRKSTPPAGMVTVPVEPTERMVRKGFVALCGSDCSNKNVGSRIGYGAMRDVWAAMLAAAPQPEPPK